MQSFHEKQEVFTIVGGRELHRKKISLFLYGKNEKYMSAFSPGKIFLFNLQIFVSNVLLHFGKLISSKT